jgi:hypothetical protein
MKLAHVYTFRGRTVDGHDFKYHNFVALVPNEFTPELNWENDRSDWVEYGHWPEPLHFGFEKLIQHAGFKVKRIVDLIKIKLQKSRAGEFWKGKSPTGTKQAQLIGENMDVPLISKRGLIDEGIVGYEMTTPHSYLRYGYEPATRTFYLHNIATPNMEDRNKGYARALLESFFQLIKQYGGALDCDTYTTSGMTFIKPVVERLLIEHRVRLMKGRLYD